MTAEEASTRIEPARIEHPSGELLDLSLEIVARAERLGRASILKPQPNWPAPSGS
ncbi:hypothetical protein [Agrobacterium tumefaciens]|uniref:hypothetical protein n=1 Tax=Agrobacterium tumefaciens TaxID=358 RepID=UPI003BA26C6F